METMITSAQIDAYVAGGAKLIAAFDGLTSADLRAIPVPGTWSLQQIATHIYDSDLIGTDRMKRIAAMPNPLICAYDESAFNALPGMEAIDALAACRAVANNRQFMAEHLRRFSPEMFARTGIHTEVGKVSLADQVVKYIHHLEHHLKFALQKELFWESHWHKPA